jgi:hypothetical protein
MSDLHVSAASLLQVGAVVCGVDPNLSYFKVQYASMCLLLNPGCLFIATNTDARGHFTPNLEWAGAGATVGAIKGELHASCKLVSCKQAGERWDLRVCLHMLVVAAAADVFGVQWC